jgi:cobaltochelatase CobN
MHLLAAQSGVIDGGAEAVDLGQTPGDIIVISAADSELASLAHAHDRLPEPKPSLRLANLMALGHNLSVDTYIERTLEHAQFIVVRLLGGEAYWPYGVERLTALAAERKIPLALLPGGQDPDPDLVRRCRLDAGTVERLRSYLAHGGPENAGRFLRLAASLIGRDEAPPPPQPFASAGLYWPGLGQPSLDEIRAQWPETRPIAAITFYRSLIEGGLTAPVDALVTALSTRGLNALPVFVSSLKDAQSAALLTESFAAAPPAVILNATGFAVSAGAGSQSANPLRPSDCPVLQVVFSGSSEEAWRDDPQGLGPRDLAMNVVLPELDGRIMTRAVSFKADRERHGPTECRIVTYRPVANRIDFVADLAANWANLGRTPPGERRVAILLANYPNRDGRIGNGVGYDTPASTLAILRGLAGAGYRVEGIPASGNALIEALQLGPTNAAQRPGGAALPLNDYAKFFAQLPETTRDAISERWGPPDRDPYFSDGAFHLPVHEHGAVVTAIQPARGYNIDPKETYHDPALPPPHGYLAFYLWLRERFRAHAVIHNGKHGNLEWLPGKANALSAACFPEAALGPLPQLYPFIVNDPGEGSQAKRRTSAVIIDHLTPPLTRAETYGPLRELEALIDEYYMASGLDRRRLAALRRRILELTQSSGLDLDAGIADAPDEQAALQKLDTYICELKEAQIRDGLHVLGASPEGALETNLLVALARIARGTGEGRDQSLIRALAADLGLDGFDPLNCVLGETWAGPRPAALATVSNEPWRSNGDTLERLELLAVEMVGSTPITVMPAKAGIPCEVAAGGEFAKDPSLRWGDDVGCMPATSLVLNSIATTLRPALRTCGASEIAAVLAGLDGRFVEPGPSGAPTRGRPDVLPTGRNFYSIDNRAVPTPTAWALGEASASALVERHFQDHGEFPRSLGLSAWGTSNMRTGGDDIAQAMALVGAKPTWDTTSWRVTGFEIIPLARLARPRVDVTLRISGFFRDAFPSQIELFDRAVRAIGSLDEEDTDNPIAARMRSDSAELVAGGLSSDEAARLAGFRVFGSKPGAYGAGLQALIDEKLWAERADLANAYIAWGSYAYGASAAGEAHKEVFSRRLRHIEAVVHNQDNREHDLLDSDDYYQFEGGMTAAVEHVSGTRPKVYHNDHSRPERPVVRTLEEEIGRVVRSRVVNPKWISGVMRHGYKGGFEIAATVDYLFAFAATTGAVKPHHFELAYDAFIGDETVRSFLADNNSSALAEIAERFDEAIARGLWTPRSNSAYHELETLKEAR